MTSNSQAIYNPANQATCVYIKKLSHPRNLIITRITSALKKPSVLKKQYAILAIIIFFLLQLFTNLLFLTQPAYADDEIRGWAETEWKFAKLSDDLWLDFKQEERWADDLSNHNSSESRLRINMKVLDWLNIGLAESYIKTDRPNQSDRVEARHILELSPFRKGEIVNFNLRQRLEMREFFGDSEGTAWRSRTRFQISGSKDFFGVVQPIIDNEFFYDLSDSEYDQNRFFAGVRFEILKGVQLSPMYGFQSQKSDQHWNSPQVFKLSLILDLPIL